CEVRPLVETFPHRKHRRVKETANEKANPDRQKRAADVAGIQGAQCTRTLALQSLLMPSNERSRAILAGRDRAPARSMLKAIGFTDQDLARPIIGVANTWIETM